MAKDITWILNGYEYPPEVTTKELLGSDYSYHKLITNVRDAERFNYHSDYWGDAQTYQDDNVDLMAALEPWVGSRCVAEIYGDKIEGTLVGILIDRQYNSIGHTCVLLSDVTDESGEKAGAKKKAAMRKKSDVVDLDDGYKLFINDEYWQMSIRKPRPYVMGESATAVSFDGGVTWSIRIDKETYFNFKQEVVDTVESDEPGYGDIVEYVRALDDELEGSRFVDKW